jgi:AcrR family transcriptional regulator
MSQKGEAGAAPRGRPRSERAREAVLAAAAELLLARGLGAVSMDAVAEQAGVSKATIYRWWSTKETLALDALYNEWVVARPAGNATGSLRSDLLALLRPWVRLVGKRPYGRVLAALITEAQTDPAFAALYRERFVEPRRDQARPILLQAIERGELPPTTNIELALDLLYGPLYHRLLHGHAPLNERFLRDLIDTVVAGLATSQASPAGRDSGGTATS